MGFGNDDCVCPDFQIDLENTITKVRARSTYYVATNVPDPMTFELTNKMLAT